MKVIEETRPKNHAWYFPIIQMLIIKTEPSNREYLNSSIHLAPYLEKKFLNIYEGEAYKFYRQRYIYIENNDHVSPPQHHNVPQ